MVFPNNKSFTTKTIPTDTRLFFKGFIANPDVFLWIHKLFLAQLFQVTCRTRWNISDEKVLYFLCPLIMEFSSNSRGLTSIAALQFQHLFLRTIPTTFLTVTNIEHTTNNKEEKKEPQPDIYIRKAGLLVSALKHFAKYDNCILLLNNFTWVSCVVRIIAVVFKCTECRETRASKTHYRICRVSAYAPTVTRHRHLSYVSLASLAHLLRASVPTTGAHCTAIM